MRALMRLTHCKYLLDGKNNLQRAMGLAIANALIKPVADQTEDREATTYFNLQPGEKVAMVGLFAPLVERIRATGASLTIIEKNPQRLDILSPGKNNKHSRIAMLPSSPLRRFLITPLRKPLPHWDRHALLLSWDRPRRLSREFFPTRLSRNWVVP